VFDRPPGLRELGRAFEFNAMPLPVIDTQRVDEESLRLRNRKGRRAVDPAAQ
jgi:hypothetical protein